MEVLINGRAGIIPKCTWEELKHFIDAELGLKPTEYYLLSNGKRVDKYNGPDCSKIHIIPTVLGGKGGFGSMLRAIGAQIEKTTNREACRDLSGRRLRDINEEQRLKNWINQQAEREKEAKERKQKKLERLCEAPKHEFKDEQYDKERSELPEIVEDAVLRGLQASCSTKRKVPDQKSAVKKKKAKLWVDDELDDDLSSSGGEDEESDSEQKSGSGTSKALDSENSNSESTRGSNEIVKSATETENVDEVIKKDSSETDEEDKKLESSKGNTETKAIERNESSSNEKEGSSEEKL